jgi:hypothetical protein
MHWPSRQQAPRRAAIGLASAVAALVIGVAAAGPAAWSAKAPAGPVWPAPPDVARVKYVATIQGPSDIGAGPGVFGRLLGFIAGRSRQPRLLRPGAVVTTTDGRVAVADVAQQMVHVFDRARRRYSYLEPGPFVSPVGLAAGPNGTIYVADSAARLVFEYGADGRRIRTLGIVGGESIFSRPTAVAVAQDGRVAVLDARGCSVTVLAPGGAVERTFGERGTEPGAFNVPTHMTMGADGRLYVVDAMNARVQVFDLDGTLVGGFGRRGNGSGDFDKPKGIALDPDGHVYVAESLHDVVQIFDRAGRLLLVVGASGSGPGQFSLPAGLHIDDAGRIYVADSLNGRVQVFQYVHAAD